MDIFGREEQCPNCIIRYLTQPFPRTTIAKLFEIGASVHDSWPCNTFHTLNENRPNLVTMNMNQIDTLQKMLAEKFCPQIANEPVHSNMAAEKEINNFVQLSSNSSKIVVEDNKRKVNNDEIRDHAKIVERRKKTFAEAVWAQNLNCVDEMKRLVTPASSH